MLTTRIGHRVFVAVLVATFSLVLAGPARAAGFISFSYGYNFGGDTGCVSATNCENKNWNPSGSLGALGDILGFEAELTHASDFTGKGVTAPTNVTTLMGDILICPKFGFAQPFALGGFGLIKTDVNHLGTVGDDTKNQFGWDVGGGIIVYVQRHIGIKGDVRYYHSFQNLDILGVDLAREDNKLDFGRAAFGVLIAF